MKRHHICSEETDFVKHKREIMSWFLKHGKLVLKSGWKKLDLDKD